MHGHLVAVKVGVEGRTHQRMQLYRPALHQHGLKGLYSQAVQGRRAVEQHGMLDYNFLQYVPDFSASALNQPFSAFDIMRQA